jgi:hypothetical protein
MPVIRSDRKALIVDVVVQFGPVEDVPVEVDSDDISAVCTPRIIICIDRSFNQSINSFNLGHFFLCNLAHNLDTEGSASSSVTAPAHQGSSSVSLLPAG